MRNIFCFLIFASLLSAKGVIAAALSISAVLHQLFWEAYTVARRLVRVVTNAVSDGSKSVSVLTDIVYYKVAKAGSVTR